MVRCPLQSFQDCKHKGLCIEEDSVDHFDRRKRTDGDDVDGEVRGGGEGKNNLVRKKRRGANVQEADADILWRAGAALGIQQEGGEADRRGEPATIPYSLQGASEHVKGDEAAPQRPAPDHHDHLWEHVSAREEPWCQCGGGSASATLLHAQDRNRICGRSNCVPCKVG